MSNLLPINCDYCQTQHQGSHCPSCGAPNRHKAGVTTIRDGIMVTGIVTMTGILPSTKHYDLIKGLRSSYGITASPELLKPP